MVQNNLKKILVPLDGSKPSFRALEMAKKIALKFDSTITVLYVHDLPTVMNYAVLDPVGKRDLDYAKKILDKARKLVGNKIPFKSKILSGNVAQKILEFAENKFDIIIIGHRGLSFGKELFLGSVSHHVLQKSKIPVLVVR